MPPKKRPASHDVSRLKVLAAGAEQPFAECVAELLASGDRLAREAALEALLERPLPDARGALRALYVELDTDGLKRDQGARMRGPIVRVLTKLADTRDADIGARASETIEKMLGDDDVTRQLRAYGLQLLAATAPDLFPYYAAEHLDDVDDKDPDQTEPANTALQLMAGTNNPVAVYQWLISGQRPGSMIIAALDLLAEAPSSVVERYVARRLDGALRNQEEPLCMTLAELIVEREFESSYAQLDHLMAAKISVELYGYLAVLLASTNRPALLQILEHELRRGRHQPVIAEALRVRTTPEQAAILKRWEEPGD